MKAPPSGRPDGRGLRVALLRSCFNAPIVDGLLVGARQALGEMGVEAITTVDVPGAFELPLAAAAAARSGRYDAVVALGAVIRGETDHYDHIARETAAGLADVARETGVPVGFGVLTVLNEKHARERSALGPRNKGAEAARAAVAMVDVLKRLGKTTEPRSTRRRERKNPRKMTQSPAGRAARKESSRKS